MDIVAKLISSSYSISAIVDTLSSLNYQANNRGIFVYRPNTNLSILSQDIKRPKSESKLSIPIKVIYGCSSANI